MADKEPERIVFTRPEAVRKAETKDEDVSRFVTREEDVEIFESEEAWRAAREAQNKR